MFTFIFIHSARPQAWDFNNENQWKNRQKSYTNWLKKILMDQYINSIYRYFGTFFNWKIQIFIYSGYLLFVCKVLLHFHIRSQRATASVELQVFFGKIIHITYYTNLLSIFLNTFRLLQGSLKLVSDWETSFWKMTHVIKNPSEQNSERLPSHNPNDWCMEGELVDGCCLFTSQRIEVVFRWLRML